MQIAAPAAGSEDLPEATPQRPARAQRWAELLARVFGLDMEKCEDCGGPIKIVSAILEPHAIKSILNHLRSAILEPHAIKSILLHLKLPDKPPGLAPARIPEQFNFN